MAKLSQQLQEQQPERISRTQRITQRQVTEKEKRTFQSLKAQATKKQQELSGASLRNMSKSIIN